MLCHHGSVILSKNILINFPSSTNVYHHYKIITEQQTNNDIKRYKKEVTRQYEETK